jgi:hypothetical protein
VAKFAAETDMMKLANQKVTAAGAAARTHPAEWGNPRATIGATSDHIKMPRIALSIGGLAPRVPCCPLRPRLPVDFARKDAAYMGQGWTVSTLAFFISIL